MNRVRRRILRLVRRATRALRAEARAWVSRGPVIAGSVLYESFAGNGALCNPEAIFRELRSTPDVPITRHIWVLGDLKANRDFQKEFAGDSSVRFVRRGTVGYFRALATSQYLVNNATFPVEFAKRAGQTYVNTWHGTPLKLMGYDMLEGAAQSGNTLRNFLSADYLLSQNSFMTSKMYSEAYRLSGVFRGRIIETGYPRVDRQFVDDGQLDDIRAQLRGSGIDINGRTVVLYAPTWNGTSFWTPEDVTDELVSMTQELQKSLGDAYLVLLKTHQSVHDFAAAVGHISHFLVPNAIPSNSVLAIADILITDYSSIFFDYLATERPIVFYRPHDEAYSDERGTYFPAEELPGPVLTNVTGVLEHLTSSSETNKAAWLESRRSWRAKFAPHDDGSASARVVDVVFRGRVNAEQVQSLAPGTRTSVLIHLGGMRSNGITSSALNLLAHLDHEKYDVSVVFGQLLSRQQRANQTHIGGWIRQFHRVGGMNGSKLTHLVRRVAERFGDGNAHWRSPVQAKMWQEEWTRCFGDAQFDLVVDFSGYTAFWATLLLHSPAATRSIWLHNDMAAETRRVIRGKMRMRRSLPSVFALYRQFDAMVSVSAALRNINREYFATRYGAKPDSFVFATNVVNERRVMEGSRGDLMSLEDHPRDPDTEEIIVPDWADQMSRSTELVWFCTVGRFSTEKNQARLLRAFAKVHPDYPESRLILVGYGPLRDELESLALALGLNNVAFIVGPYNNPFPIVAAADCFVLSSDYEGQPMVLLEAAIVGLPIVSVRFGSIEGALPINTIRVVEQTDDDLAEGMRAFLRGEVEASTLDAVAYNEAALEEFRGAVTHRASIDVG